MNAAAATVSRDRKNGRILIERTHKSLLITKELPELRHVNHGQLTPLFRLPLDTLTLGS